MSSTPPRFYCDSIEHVIPGVDTPRSHSDSDLLKQEDHYVITIGNDARKETAHDLCRACMRTLYHHLNQYPAEFRYVAIMRYVEGQRLA